MHFSITGHLGSGKTTICNRLVEDYGFTRIHAGAILREFAKEKGMSILEFTQYRLTHEDGKKYDEMVDKRIIEIAKENPDKDLIFDSRLAFHFVPNTFKIYIMVSPYIAAFRTYLVRNDDEEKYESLEQAKDQLIERRVAENKNYKKIYGIDVEDLSQYDVVIDTSSINVETAIDIIMDCYKKKCKGVPYKKLWISPLSLFPTKAFEKVDLDKVQGTAAAIVEHQERVVELLRFHDALFILDGHGVVLAYSVLHEPLLNPVIVMDNEDVKRKGIDVKDIIRVTKDEIDTWAKLNGFTYNYYPRIIEKMDDDE